MDLEVIKSATAIETEVKERLEEAKLICDQADGLKITSDDDVQYAKDNIIVIRKVSKDIDDIRVSITKPMDAMKKKIKAAYDGPITILTTALNVYSKKMSVYIAERTKKAEAQQRKLNAIADEKARKDKEKLEKKAVKAEESGKTEVADSLREQKEMVVPEAPVITTAPAMPKGSYWKDNWSVQIIDIDKIPREYMQPNMEALNKIAGPTKGTLKIAGVVFVNDRKLISRS